MCVAVYMAIRSNKDSLDFGQSPIAHALGTDFESFFGLPKNSIGLMCVVTYLAVLKLFFNCVNN